VTSSLLLVFAVATCAALLFLQRRGEVITDAALALHVLLLLLLPLLLFRLFLFLSLLQRRHFLA
jgi:hypothetical protein